MIETIHKVQASEVPETQEEIKHAAQFDESSVIVTKVENFNR